MLKRDKTIRTIPGYCLILVGLCWAAPTLWLLSTSLKPEDQILSLPPRWIPEMITGANYRQLFSLYPVARWTLNSLIVSVLGTAVTLAIDVLAAYALARLKFRGNGLIFGLVISTILFPVHITVIPLYMILAKVRLLNTYLALILPTTVNGFGIFLLRQFFMGIPKEIEDAARIDGCSAFGVLARIMLPLSKPALSSAGIFLFSWSWNDFLWPLMVSSNEASMTLPVGLAMFMPASQVLGQVPRYGISMAGALSATLPAIMVFVLTQRYFVQGIVTSGLKG